MNFKELSALQRALRGKGGGKPKAYHCSFIFIWEAGESPESTVCFNSSFRSQWIFPLSLHHKILSAQSKSEKLIHEVINCNFSKWSTIPNLFSLLESTYIELKASSTSLPPLTQSSRPRLRLSLKACLRRVAGVWPENWPTQGHTHTDAHTHACLKRVLQNEHFCAWKTVLLLLYRKTEVWYLWVWPQKKTGNIITTSCLFPVFMCMTCLYIYDLEKVWKPL